MGGRGSSAKLGSTKFKMSEYGVRVDMRTFRHVNKEHLERGLQGIHELITDMNLSKDMVPFIDMRCIPLQDRVLGRCTLCEDENEMNNIYISEHYMQADSDLPYMNVKLTKTYIHEYIHALESALIKTHLSNSSDRIVAWNDCEFARGIISKSIESFGGKAGAWRQYAGKISEYAKHDHSEALAEIGSHYIIALRNNFAGYTKSEIRFMRSVMTTFRNELKALKGYRKSK